MTRSPALTCLLSLTFALPFATSLSGCSDDGGEDEILGDGDGDLSSTTPGDGDPDPGDGDPDPGDGDPDPGDGDPGDGDPGDGDGDPDPGDGDPGDGDGDPDPVDESTYTAVIQPGGVNRIVITRTNTDENYQSCTRMVLWSPMQSDMFDIDVPDTWRIEEVRAWKQGFCPMDISDPDLMPDEGTGTISFAGLDALGTFPCALNFDLELDMNSDPPSTRQWFANGIVVDGVNCG